MFSQGKPEESKVFKKSGKIKEVIESRIVSFQCVDFLHTQSHIQLSVTTFMEHSSVLYEVKKFSCQK